MCCFGTNLIKESMRSKTMKKLITLLLAVLMCVSLCACGGDAEPSESQSAQNPGTSTNGSNENGSGETTTQGTESTPNTTDPVTPGIPLSDDLADFTVSIDGVVYQLPCSPQVFFDNGWLPESAWVLEDDYVYPGDSTGSLDLYKEGENKEIGLRICNLSKNDKPLRECIVIEIYNEVDTDVEFVLSGGFSLRTNVTDQDVFDAFGSEYSHNEFNGDWYEYTFPGKGSYTFTIKEGYLAYFSIELAAAIYENSENN